MIDAQGASQKKIVFLANASAKALTPPPTRAVSKHSDCMQVFFTCINIYIFEREKPDDFKRKKGENFNILRKYLEIFALTSYTLIPLGLAPHSAT